MTAEDEAQAWFNFHIKMLKAAEAGARTNNLKVIEVDGYRMSPECLSLIIKHMEWARDEVQW